MVKLKLIYNPTAGRGRTRRHAQEVERYLREHGAMVDAHASESPADLTRAAADASRAGYDRVVICGGDGTVHYAVRDFDLEQGTLAVVPLGSGDDFARVLGIPRSVKESCDIALSGTVREVDVALANNIRYLGVAGLGFDSEVAAYANSHATFLRGSIVYLYAILCVLPRFNPHPVRIRMESGTRAQDIMFACVGNTRQYGGGIMIVPDAQLDDGLLDYCIVDRATRFQLLTTLPLAYSGKHVRKPFVETGRGREFHFESAQALEVFADGERVTQTPVEFRLEKQKLRICVPSPA